MKINDMLMDAMSKRASDLHLMAGSAPILRIDGELSAQTEFSSLTPEEVEQLFESVTNAEQQRRFKETLELDFAHGIPGMGRFRANACMQRGTMGLTFRLLQPIIPDLEEIGLPDICKDLSLKERGLVLITGPAGSGKSTTLACMLKYLNSLRRRRIITIEDPIEFLHRDKKAFVNQREVEVDTPSFGSALRAALRQDPDVILVGEMRDLETIQTALLAAETGHLVFSTLHTLDATETIQRIIAVFPPPEQKQIRLQMATTLRAVISQRLVKKSDGIGRVPAVEVLIATEYIRDCIINPEKTRLIHDAIAAGVSQYGMQTFDQSLYDLYTQGLISLEEALLNSSNPDEFKLRIAGIRSTADSAREEMERAGQTDRFAKR
jgi:twitching motility protein PilT